ncbi:zinc-finger domain-containing protein [Duganella caerulea]
MRESVKIVVLLSPPEHTNMTNAHTSAATNAVELEGKDLPAHCPNPAMPLWSSHPRVFLEFNHDGIAKCPYCGTAYRLKPGTVVGHH